jgi:predicted nucleic acid-binding protein
VTLYLLDTIVISDLIKPVSRRSREVPAWLANQDPIDLFLSSITIGKIGAGLEVMAEGEAKAKYEAWFEALHEEEFAERILPFDLDAALVYRAVAASVQRYGWQKHARDMQNAAIALLQGMHVVTRNVSDYDRCGVVVVNPWGDTT